MLGVNCFSKFKKIWSFGKFFKFVTLTLSCFDLESNMNWSIVWVIMERRGVSSERRRSSSSSWFCYGLRQVRKTCSYNSDHVKYTGGGLWRYISYIFWVGWFGQSYQTGIDTMRSKRTPSRATLAVCCHGIQEHVLLSDLTLTQAF